MKNLGLLIIVIGFFGLCYFFDMDTTVSTEGRSFGYGINVPSMKVNNIGLMEDRRNGLIVSGLATLIGVIFYVAGKAQESKSVESKSNVTQKIIDQKTKKCPFCAEDIKKEAILCRHCNRDVPEEVTTA